MSNRRSFLKSVGTAPLLGAFPAGGAAQAASGKRDFFKELGVRPFLNAAGTYTALTASLMPAEVMKAMEYASKSFVRLNELHDAVGVRIASMLGCEAAMVTAGAASALTLGTAACMTGENPDFIRRIPDTAGMKTEVIIQKSHRFAYDHAVRNCGIRFVEVETVEELERAVNANTVMMLFLNANGPIGKIKVPEFIELGKKHAIPTFNDAAADVPPAEALRNLTGAGFDLVTFSGGKGLCGPQSAGLLLGRKDLIRAARLNTSPNSDSIGRGMKVNKEEMVGMMVALELYLRRNHAAEAEELQRRARLIASSVTSVPGVTAEIRVPPVANHVPHVHIVWDESALKLTVAEAVRRLREGEPSIEVVPGSKKHLIVNAWMLRPGEVKIVAKRLRDVLRGA